MSVSVLIFVNLVFFVTIWPFLINRLAIYSSEIKKLGDPRSVATFCLIQHSRTCDEPYKYVKDASLHHF